MSGGAVTVGHDGDPPESSPQLTVVLDSFYMDLTEVTLKRYERYRQALNEERGRKVVAEPENASSPPEFPVLGLTLKQAEFYAHWAHKELPTEAEWERAARGEASFPHPWGNGRAIWSQARKQNTITAVKTFGTDVSPFGIYDLAGNAREWCTDRWSADGVRRRAQQELVAYSPAERWKGAAHRHGAGRSFHVVKGKSAPAGMPGIARVMSSTQPAFHRARRLPLRAAAERQELTAGDGQSRKAALGQLRTSS